MGWGKLRSRLRMWWLTAARERGKDERRNESEREAELREWLREWGEGFYFRLREWSNSNCKVKRRCIKKKKKKGEFSPDRCRLSLETNEPCELPKLVTVHRTRQSDRSPYESLLFLHGTVLDVKQTVEMAGSRFSQLDCTIRSEFQNYDCASWILIKRS